MWDNLYFPPNLNDSFYLTLLLKYLFVSAELSVMNKIKKNKLSKAIYLMQKALFVFENDPTSTCSQNFLTVTIFYFYFCPDIQLLLQ